MTLNQSKHWRSIHFDECWLPVRWIRNMMAGVCDSICSSHLERFRHRASPVAACAGPIYWMHTVLCYYLLLSTQTSEEGEWECRLHMTLKWDACHFKGEGYYTVPLNHCLRATFGGKTIFYGLLPAVTAVYTFCWPGSHCKPLCCSCLPTNRSGGSRRLTESTGWQVPLEFRQTE